LTTPPAALAGANPISADPAKYLHPVPVPPRGLTTPRSPGSRSILPKPILFPILDLDSTALCATLQA